MFKMFKKNRSEPKCKNCLLYNPNKGTCGVAILHEGKQMHLPVEAEDDCFFENEFVAKNGDEFRAEVQEVRWWVDNPDEKGNGQVKMEYPDGFFGKED